MSPPSPEHTSAITEKTEAARQERLKREADALRENLRRRKQQARTRAENEQSEPQPSETSEG